MGTFWSFLVLGLPAVDSHVLSIKPIQGVNVKRLLLLIGLLLTACGTARQSHGGPVQDQVAPPHFFLKERVLVIYVGKDPSVISLLGGVLGPQFAGA